MSQLPTSMACDCRRDFQDNPGGAPKLAKVQRGSRCPEFELKFPSLLENRSFDLQKKHDEPSNSKITITLLGFLFNKVCYSALILSDRLPSTFKIFTMTGRLAGKNAIVTGAAG